MTWPTPCFDVVHAGPFDLATLTCAGCGGRISEMFAATQRENEDGSTSPEHQHYDGSGEVAPPAG